MKNEDFIKALSALTALLNEQQLDIYFKDATIERLKKTIAEAETSTEGEE